LPTVRDGTVPPCIASIVGLSLIGTEFNDVTIKVLGAFSSTIVPLALGAVGLQLQLKLLKEEITPFSVALIIKLLIAPL
ncbi:AEC family transporter, partial [Aliarcobacter butzleri]